MNRALIAAALLMPAASPARPQPQAVCLPAPPPRTVPRRHYERVDKWQFDQRTVT